MKDYVLQLFVTGKTSRSQRAIDNIRRICSEHLGFEYKLTIVDVLESPQLAEDQKVLATPTLIKIMPPPVRRIVGDLSAADVVTAALDIRVENQEANP